MKIIPILNQQKVEKKEQGIAGFLDVQDIFYTIQGEGPFAGFSAVFVRLAGCNLQCPGCDTDYTSGRKIMTYNEIILQVNSLIGEKAVQQPNNGLTKPPIVVITGGEPFRQNITELCNTLANYLTVQVETNGSFAPPNHLSKNVTIVCSPKTHSINKQMMKRANCFKYVLNHNSVDATDGLPIKALDHSCSVKGVARPLGRPDALIYLQPMDCKDENVNELNLQAVLLSCLKHGYILQLQIHKYLGIA
jgi:7-carboxy-7-deazaguanine synthase